MINPIQTKNSNLFNWSCIRKVIKNPSSFFIPRVSVFNPVILKQTLTLYKKTLSFLCFYIAPGLSLCLILYLVDTNSNQSNTGQDRSRAYKKGHIISIPFSINTYILLNPKTLHEVNNITKYFMVFIIKDAALYDSVLFHRPLIQHKSYPFLH